MKLLRTALVSSLALLATGCRHPLSSAAPPREPTPAEEALASREIESVTEGAVDRMGPVVVRFVRPWAADDEVGKDAGGDWLAISPEVDGRLWWRDNRTLVWEPSHPLEPGVLHHAVLDLPGLTGDARLPRWPFAFGVAPLQADLVPRSLEREAGGWGLTVELRADTLVESPEKGFEAKQDGRSLPLTWKPSGGTSGTIRLGGIRRGGGHVVLRAEAEGLGLSEDLERRWEIPAEGALGVFEAEPFADDGREGFDVRLSEAPGALPDLEGMVEVGDIPEPKLEVDGNRLRVSWEAKGQSARMTLLSGLRAASGARLPRDASFDHLFGDLRPRVSFLQKGSILPSAARDRLHFQAVNLAHVRVRVWRVRASSIPDFLAENSLDPANGPLEHHLGKLVWERVIDLSARANRPLNGALDLSSLMKGVGTGLYSIQLSKVREGNLYGCPDSAGSTGTESDGQDYDWDGRENPCTRSYWAPWWGNDPRMNVLVSDIGLMAWRDPSGRVEVAATDLVRGEPWKDVRIDGIAPDDSVLASARTDGEGFAVLAGLSEAALLRASAVKDGREHLAFLKLAEGEARNLSRFDAGGTARPDGLRLHLWTERGAYRPGDSIFAGCIVRGSDERPLDRLPLSLRLVDPLGRTVATSVQKAAPDGHFGWRTATRPEDPTGRWTLVAEAGPASASVPLRVETLRPNRLKIRLHTAGTVLGEGAASASADLSSNWLSGGSAAGLRASVDLSLARAPFAPPGLSTFVFEDPSTSWDASEEQPVWSGELDASGTASFRIPLPESGKGPGLLQGWLRTRVFEPGGAASFDRQPVLLSPYASYAGVRLDMDSRWGAVDRGDRVGIEAVSVDPLGRRLAGRSLEVHVYANPEWWWWEEGNRYLGFVSRSDTREVWTGTVRSGSRLDYVPREGGQYLVLLRDPVSGHVAGTGFSVWSWSDGASGGRAAPALLSVRPVRDTVAPGGALEVAFASPEGGRALVQTMSGRRILSRQWVSTSAPETRWKGRVPPGAGSGVYIEVTVLQKYPTPSDRPLRLWGLAHVAVVDPATRLRPVLALPAELRPESVAKVRLSEASGRPMRAWVALVDEGLLDLTRQPTPDPWAAFHAKEALEVRGWDLHDLVIGAWSGRLDRMFAVGGSEDALRRAAGRKGNPFPPMVVVRGPFDVPRGGKTLELPIPRYAGSVRAMVVASSGESFGSFERAVPVRAPVMALVTVPRGMSPGDSGEIPVTVFSQKAGRVRVRLSVSGPIALDGPAERTIDFGSAGDQVATFPVHARGGTGPARFVATASSAHGSAQADAGFEVRAAGSPLVRVQEALVSPASPWSLGVQPWGLPGTRSTRLIFSTSGIAGLENRLDELVRYPHGCLEQTVSAALPQLFLRTLVPGASDGQLARADANVRAAIARLPRFQIPSGGFSLWPGEGRPYEFGTIWAADFLVSAREAGHETPASLWGPLASHLAEACRRWHPGAYAQGDDTLAQVLRLDVLARAGHPEAGLMNRLRGAPLRDLHRWILSAAYASAGRGDAAAELSRKAGTAVSPARSTGGWLGSPLRDRALMLEAMVRAGRRDRAASILPEVRRELSDGSTWISTQEGGSGLRAMARYLGGAKAARRLEVDWRLGSGPWKRAVSEAGRLALDLPASASGILEVRSTNGAVQARLERTAVPPPEALPPPPEGLEIAVRYIDGGGAPLDPSRLPTGADFRIVAAVRNTSGVPLENLALVQLFPGGWEIRSAGLEGEAGPVSASVRRMELRDDRSVHFLDLPVSGSAVVVLGARAAYAGSWVRPGAQVQALYDARIQASLPGGRSLVLPP